MDTLTLVPVSSYLDADTKEGNTFYAYFSTSSLHRLLEYIGNGKCKFAVFGCSGIVNNIIHFYNKLSIRILKNHVNLLQQNEVCFAGIAFSACNPDSMYPYIYEIMTSVPIKSMMVMLISPKSFQLLNFDSSFPDWYRQNKRNN